LSVLINRKGAVVQRDSDPSPRLGKSLDFLMPRFPVGSLRRGKTWTESVQWVEFMGDWKIAWAGELQWRLIGQAECGKGLCEELEYKGVIRPRLLGGPSWASGAIRGLRY